MIDESECDKMINLQAKKQRKQFNYLQLLPMKICEFIKRYINCKKNQSCKNPLNTRKNADMRGYENMIKVLFVCHGRKCGVDDISLF